MKIGGGYARSAHAVVDALIGLQRAAARLVDPLEGGGIGARHIAVEPGDLFGATGAVAEFRHAGRARLGRFRAEARPRDHHRRNHCECGAVSTRHPMPQDRISRHYARRIETTGKRNR